MRWPEDLGRALRFLSVVSVGGGGKPGPGGTAGSLYMFPVAGLALGAIAAAAGIAAYYLFGSPVHAVVAVAAAALVTAGLHLDGLADTCDAVFSWRDRARRLQIMQDSRIGVMGALALIFVIALKIAALLALGENWWIGVLISAAFGRWADVYAIVRFPAAKNEGLGAGVHAASCERQLSRASVSTVIIASPLIFWSEWYGVVIAALGATAVVHGLASSIARSLGGLTGDVYGALSEVGEVAALLAICAVLA